MMRAISLVDHLEFDFAGNVLRNAITLGDVDNDGCNELVVGGENGELAVFKGNKLWLSLSGLGFISCVAVGNILNLNKNFLVVITGDGWCHIYATAVELSVLSESSEVQTDDKLDEGVEQVDGQIFSSESVESEQSVSGESVANSSVEKTVLKEVHLQRIPANTKDIILGDISGDGAVEMVLGLTDRIVRSYRWAEDITSSQANSFSDEGEIKISGKLVCLNKWECANQIGSVTLHHSRDGSPSLLVAQPGGTFMRIVCQPEEYLSQSVKVATENIETSSTGSDGLLGTKIDYQFLGLSRMRNQNISTEILGDLNTGVEDDSFQLGSENEAAEKGSLSSVGSDLSGDRRGQGRPYVVATLDGSIILVRDEVILWAFAVDHQIFAVNKLDVTGNGRDDIVACSWDGLTYILDQEKNSVRFQFDEPVQSFYSGYYSVEPNSAPVTCFVYVTFRDKICVYYDIPLKDMICRKFEPDLSSFTHNLPEELKGLSQKELVEYLLYRT